MYMGKPAAGPSLARKRGGTKLVTCMVNAS